MDVDVGHPSPAVFTHLEYDLEGRDVAAFVSRYGDAYCLTRQEVELRIRYLESQGHDTLEERKALAALKKAAHIRED